MADSGTTTDTSKYWEGVNIRVEKWTNSLCDSWRSEMSNLLIFASLFSAIVTAFTLEAARDIQADPAEQTVLLLRTLVLQVHNISNPQANLPLSLTPDDSVTVSLHTQQIYLLYCISLSLSLISVLGGITALQWLREFNQNVTGVSPSNDIYVQYQRHKSLKKWKVLGLLNTLPILLLAALFIFFVGFLMSQWESGAVATKPVSVLVGIILVIFIFMTTLLPARVGAKRLVTAHDTTVDNSSDAPLPCPYRSPQAWLTLVFFYYILRGIQKLSAKRPNPPGPFSEINSWTECDKWWIQKHTTEKSIYPALFWVATEFNQTKDAVLMAYQCIISSFADSYCEYLKKLPKNETVPDSTTWSAFGLSTISQIENQFTRDKPMLLGNTYFGAFSRIWAVVREKDLKVDSSNDIYQILRVETSSETECSALLKSISSSLSHPENVWMTEAVVAATCHVIDLDQPRQHFSYCNDIISILREMCERYTKDDTLYIPMLNLCKKLVEKLSSKHWCEDLLIIFNGVFRTLDLETLGNLGFILRKLLVRCPTCYIPFWRAEQFLKIINNLASERLITKDHTLDAIFKYTSYVLQHSTGLHRILPTIDTTLNTILSAAEEYVRPGSTSTDSVLHPSKFSITRRVAYRAHQANELKLVWDLTNNFNKRLKEIWGIEQGGVNTGTSGQIAIQRIKEHSNIRDTSTEVTTREGEITTQIVPNLSDTEASTISKHDRDIYSGVGGSDIEMQHLASTPPLLIDTPSNEPESSSSQAITNNLRSTSSRRTQSHDNLELQQRDTPATMGSRKGKERE